jgi:squalene-hopene/tetraprenyl-beta-curcumene cyclase
MPEVGPAVTSMVVKGLIQSGVKADDPIVAKALKFVQSTRKPDGGFYVETTPSYNTAITMSLLAVLPQTDEIKKQIADAQKFIKSTQMLEGSKDKDGKEITKDHPWYGGAGYAGKGAKSPDMSNTSYFIDSLIETGVSKDDPAIKAALVYTTRNQALSETNDQPWAKTLSDGGFIYSTSTPGRESMFPPTERDGQQVLTEYGSMTYAGLKSFIHAGLTKDDVRVKAAMKWIGGHWTLEENPGTGKETGLYYYYHTFAKALKTYGEDKVKDSKGVEHDWRAELAAAFTKRQKDDGSFVNAAEARWMEGNPLLATAYSVLAMQEARK